MLLNGFKSFRANLSNLPEMISFICQCAMSNKITEDKIKEIELASEEALVNIIKYAYKNEQQGDVLIKCFSANDKFNIQITDSGEPFNPLDMPDPDISQNIEDRKIGGLGIFFIKQFMDTVHYQRHKDHNVLTMSVKLKSS
ncbi:MAG: ATP-binding protein [Thermodesulfovibrionales bacterium]|nr:ATP-binding protein [Thermodesulfovibrionales bacterium]